MAGGLFFSFHTVDSSLFDLLSVVADETAKNNIENNRKMG
jgi:hypothetical protein